MASSPKSVVSHGNRKGRDSSQFGRRGSGDDRVASTITPEKRGVREPDQNFPAGDSADRNRGPKEP